MEKVAVTPNPAAAHQDKVSAPPVAEEYDVDPDADADGDADRDADADGDGDGDGDDESDETFFLGIDMEYVREGSIAVLMLAGIICITIFGTRHSGHDGKAALLAGCIEGNGVVAAFTPDVNLQPFFGEARWWQPLLFGQAR